MDVRIAEAIPARLAGERRGLRGRVGRSARTGDPLLQYQGLIGLGIGLSAPLGQLMCRYGPIQVMLLDGVGAWLLVLASR